MARGQISVDTAQLDAVAKQVDSQANEYETEYKKLFETITQLKEAWDGKDNQAYTQQIEGFRDDFQRMTKLMRDYADYLRKVAEAYRTTQENLATSARSTLSTGS